MLTFHFFGNPDVLVQRKSISDQLSSKSLALLAYLVANKERSFTRDHLACLLWNQSGKEAAISNLRYNLWSINKVMESNVGDSLLYTKKDKIQLRGEVSFVSDLHQLATLDVSEEPRTLEQLKMLYKGEFLEGFYLKECIDFNDWVFYEREKNQRRFIDLLEALLTQKEKEGAHGQSLVLIEEMLKINPYDESLTVRAIQILLAEGDRTAALAHYRRCVQVLREELNIAPADETRAWLDRIKNCEPIKRVTPKPTTKPPGKKKQGIVLPNRTDMGKIPYGLLVSWLEILYHERGTVLREAADPQDLREIGRLVLPYLRLSKSDEPPACTEAMADMRLFGAVARTFAVLGREETITFPSLDPDGVDEKTIAFLAYMKNSPWATRCAFERVTQTRDE